MPSRASEHRHPGNANGYIRMGLQIKPEAPEARVGEVPVLLEHCDKSSEFHRADVTEYPGQSHGLRVGEFYEVKGPRVIGKEKGAVKARPPPEALPSGGKFDIPEGQRAVGFNKDHLSVFRGRAFRVADLRGQIKGQRPESSG